MLITAISSMDVDQIDEGILAGLKLILTFPHWDEAIKQAARNKIEEHAGVQREVDYSITSKPLEELVKTLHEQGVEVYRFVCKDTKTWTKEPIQVTPQKKLKK